MVGRSLGHYRILEKIGAGGMGEVYRAADSKLGRDVAIKVLPDLFARDPDRLARFEREAHVLASLNHPNIAAIYGLEESDDVRFLVLELVPGEMLAGPLEPSEALNVCHQIAEALESAHEKGIVHRDLKPANIKITPEGQVKVLDFGLAKAFAGDSTATDLSHSPTATIGATRAGVILGTAAYMSPEQARGRGVDRRTDIWAFGCVLYEALTGRQAFGGETVADIFTGILGREPDWQALPAATPFRVRELLRRCLQKDPRRRLQHIGDARLDIDEAGSEPPTPAAAPAPRRNQLPWVVAAIFAALAVVLGVAYWLRPAPEARAVRSFILPPEKSTFVATGAAGGATSFSLAVSPDGRRVAFIASTADGKQLLWVRPLDALTAQSLAGTEGAGFPFWSPDSRFLGFFADGKLKKIDAGGGPAQTLCNAPAGRGGTWNRDGVIVFAPDRFAALSRVSSSGGEAASLTKLPLSQLQTSHRWPYLLPDGHFLYTVVSGFGSENEATTIFVASLDLKENRPLLHAHSNAAYASGHVLYARAGVLMAQPFDPARRQLTGEAFPVAERLRQDNLTVMAQFSVSENGVLAYQEGPPSSAGRMLWFDRGGKEIGSVGEPGAYISPRISPDGGRVASDVLVGNGDVWIWDLSRGLGTRFTFDPAMDLNPIWSPDGGRIIFASNRKGGFLNLYEKASSGAGSEQALLESPWEKRPTSWSSDGRFVAYFEVAPKTKLDVWILPLFGDRKPFAFLQTEFNEAGAEFSPDGRWIAYHSDESGRPQVYVAPFPASAAGGKWQVSAAGGREPRWRRDGKELLFLAADNKLMSVEVDGKGPSFQVGAAKPLFEAHPALGGGPARLYDVSADGKRFLVSTTMTEEKSAPITLVVNWTAGLRR